MQTLSYMFWTRFTKFGNVNQFCSVEKSLLRLRVQSILAVFSKSWILYSNIGSNFLRQFPHWMMFLSEIRTTDYNFGKYEKSLLGVWLAKTKSCILNDFRCRQTSSKNWSCLGGSSFISKKISSEDYGVKLYLPTSKILQTCYDHARK